jgi:hypothetical protein
VPTTRIVFDGYVPANSYLSAVTQARNVSYAMGEILDSYYVRNYPVRAPSSSRVTAPEWSG